MSNNTKEIEYGTRKPNVSIALNVPYMIQKLSDDYNKLISLRNQWNLKLVHGECDIDFTEEILTQESYLDRIEKTVSQLRSYVEKCNINISDYRWSRYYRFYVNNIDDFIVTYRSMINYDKSKIGGV